MTEGIKLKLARLSTESTLKILAENLNEEISIIFISYKVSKASQNKDKEPKNTRKITELKVV